ncbi:hypothetical protein EZS27_009214 [termite gut metagenome]|uniref:Uncharacterized protein n=1 Tax=termite gut metagenome TaxID=433724 RepID=A0A5J4SCQ7_9ZZZZ
MFKTEYIYELTDGNLSKKGYGSLLGCIAYFVRKYNWSKNIIASETVNSNYWSADDIKELAHLFFEWAITKRKFDYLNKIPESYLSYYFLQILISFVANRISEEQQKAGLSFEKCKELVAKVSKEKYFYKEVKGIAYLFNNSFENKDIKSDSEINSSLKHLSHYRIPESTKHYKSLVLMALEDIFNIVESPVALPKLFKTVFELFDQSSFTEIQNDAVYFEERQETDSPKYKSIIRNILVGISKEDAQIVSEYLFQSNGEASLSVLAEKYGLAKSTLHYKTESFKKKITENYIPDNEEDGINFLQNLSAALDELAK